MSNWRGKVLKLILFCFRIERTIYNSDNRSLTSLLCDLNLSNKKFKISFFSLRERFAYLLLFFIFFGGCDKESERGGKKQRHAKTYTTHTHMHTDDMLVPCNFIVNQFLYSSLELADDVFSLKINAVIFHFRQFRKP